MWSLSFECVVDKMTHISYCLGPEPASLTNRANKQKQLTVNGTTHSHRERTPHPKNPSSTNLTNDALVLRGLVVPSHRTRGSRSEQIGSHLTGTTQTTPRSVHSETEHRAGLQRRRAARSVFTEKHRPRGWSLQRRRTVGRRRRNGMVAMKRGDGRQRD
ncbi:hypothetical protein F511_05198 [Dorcoceras hygrometricum]|uniref:Uncharacterized protein n=1 Tax=Dorcoceras hygrometricum TaxID=472368 RepID=A0A2Z7C904_9LAMI|nr:hypothetical protein F511_05198 [Dorcoceras hygrometricum]